MLFWAVVQIKGVGLRTLLTSRLTRAVQAACQVHVVNHTLQFLTGLRLSWRTVHYKQAATPPPVGGGGSDLPRC